MLSVLVQGRFDEPGRIFFYIWVWQDIPAVVPYLLLRCLTKVGMSLLAQARIK